MNLSVGRKAINDYKKATKDTNGTIELMVHYVTIGTQFSLNYGGMNEEFYESLISMFHSVLKILVNADNNTKAKYIAELADVVHSARQINCGYYDEISDLLNDFFHENESK